MSNKLTLPQAKKYLADLKAMNERHELTPEGWQQYFLVEQIIELLEEQDRSLMNRIGRVLQFPITKRVKLV